MNAVTFCISQVEPPLLGFQAIEMMMLLNGAEVKNEVLHTPAWKAVQSLEVTGGKQGQCMFAGVIMIDAWNCLAFLENTKKRDK